VKLRPVAGDEAFGKQVVALRDALIYTETPFDISLMRAMRERQVRHLVTAGTFNAKFSPGGLVDLEYLVQGLQITHGRRHPPLRQTNTLAALEILRQLGVLTHEHNVQLREAYAFLRELIEALRMVRGNAKDLHVPSPDSDEFTFLARRLAYEGHVQSLRDHLYQYTLAVQELNDRLLA